MTGGMRRPASHLAALLSVLLLLLALTPAGAGAS